jgi:hypothetical protein
MIDLVSQRSLVNGTIIRWNDNSTRKHGIVRGPLPEAAMVDVEVLPAHEICECLSHNCLSDRDACLPHVDSNLESLCWRSHQTYSVQSVAEQKLGKNIVHCPTERNFMLSALPIAKVRHEAKNIHRKE